MKRSPVISATTEEERATAAASQPIFHRRGGGGGGGEAEQAVNNCLKQIMRVPAKTTSTPEYCLCLEVKTKKTL